MVILGISALYHDSAAAIIIDGKVKVAMHEERFSRVKHDKSFPLNAIRACLEDCSLTIANVDIVTYYEKPLLKFERLLDTFHQHAPKGLNTFLKSMPKWGKESLFIKKIIRKELGKLGIIKEKTKILFSEHHLSHASQSYFGSGYNNAAILVIDGVGEWVTSTIGYGHGNKIKILEEQHYPHSLGLLYSSFTYFLGFKVNSGEYKLMGLAPFGDDNSNEYQKYKRLILDNLLTVKKNGSITINQSFFDYSIGSKMIKTNKWEKLFGIKKREPESKLNLSHCNLALAIQHLVEDISLRIVKYVKKLTNSNNLCLSGGFFLNGAVNGKIVESNIFENVHVPFAPGDAGGAIGACLAIWNIYLEKKTHNNTINNVYLGRKYEDKLIKNELLKKNAFFVKYSKFDALISDVTTLLSEGKIIGWYQGRSEFGPRALGNRSILADPRLVNAQNVINNDVKFRESFRPFAPAILQSHANQYFNIVSSPHMQFVKEIRQEYQFIIKDKHSRTIVEQLQLPRSPFPSITHVDFTSRVQTVNRKDNERFWQLLTHFHNSTGCPMLLNTSFNIRGEPIVETPYDALNCFYSSGIDYLVINNFLLKKRIWNR
ncbi:carbamoyltransferase [Persicobacter diffluens]|uniref:Carbamoyltransferase n=1 Tax=Persicobacter diffluens TaxID=981 RepID=A0AAN4W5C0_9BACT|nr:carbamoyltransferase [Persicobacter diffluens]